MFLLVVVMLVTFQNRQVMMTSFGWCWCSGETPQSPNCWSSCNVRGNIGAGVMEGDSGIVMEEVCGDDMRNLGGGLVLMLMRAGYLVGGLYDSVLHFLWIHLRVSRLWVLLFLKSTVFFSLHGGLSQTIYF